MLRSSILLVFASACGSNSGVAPDGATADGDAQDLGPPPRAGWISDESYGFSGAGPHQVRHFDPCFELTETEVRAGGCYDTVRYVDAAGATRRLPYRITAPIGASGRRPMVVFQHGGGPSFNGRSAQDNLVRFLGSHGYVVVQMSVVGHCAEPGANSEYSRCPSTPAQDLACSAVGITDATACRDYTPMWFYRPTDASETFTQWPRIAAAVDQAAAAESLGLVDLADPSRAAMSGHSAGTAPTMMLAGAVWDFSGAPAGTNRSFRDDRFRAFLALAPNPLDPSLPSGDNVNRGWDATAFASIPSGVPFLSISGTKDFSLESPACQRRGPFFGSSTGNKFLLWVVDAVHSTLVLNTSGNASIDALAEDWTGRNPCTDVSPGRTAADGRTLDFGPTAPNSDTDRQWAPVRDATLVFLGGFLEGNAADLDALRATPNAPDSTAQWAPTPTRMVRRGLVTP